MLSIGEAVDEADFLIAADFGRRFGEWDVRMCEPLGFSAADIITTFHDGNSVAEIADKFRRSDACLYIARWSGEPAGTVAFNVFSDSAYELHKFYVVDEFRGKGIGSTLLRSVLAAVTGRDRQTLVLHTTPYMTDAVKLYEAFGFRPCARFRDTPEHLQATDLFMSRAI